MKRDRRTRRPVRTGMRVRAYEVLRRAIEEGIEYGWQRARKYTETPDETTIKDEIAQGIMNEVCEYFDFDEPPTTEAERT